VPAITGTPESSLVDGHRCRRHLFEVEVLRLLDGDADELDRPALVSSVLVVPLFWLLSVSC
jgi:hypothetical protein